ncbi:hypothetical protein QUV83_01900 [Cellulomonas cellasea]|uniref:hypothetical protein n=1 Tax=Cellulomonas cellasea TaxID=43670 RepID=UPI0025A444E3|nr:hypothetical protein [Cellulomonas cellasea]MDM8083519.1 hypothetical protein [Cellulomonas cellasea]
MPIFELDEGRPLLVQPMQPAAGTFTPDASALVTEHLTALVGEELFPVTTRTAPEGTQLLALDAAGRPVVVETAPVLDGPALVRALNHAGTAATRTRGEVLRAYDGGRSAFDADLAAFRERVPMRGGSADGTVRLVLVCAEVASEVGDAVAFLRSIGRHVEVLQTGVVQGADGRRFVQVSAWSHDDATARRAVEPTALPSARTGDPATDAATRHAHTAAQATVPAPMASPLSQPATSQTPLAPLPVASVEVPAPAPYVAEPRRPESGRRTEVAYPTPARPTPASARIDETIVLPAGLLDDFDDDLERTRPSADRWEPAHPATGAHPVAGLLDVAAHRPVSRRRDPASEWPDLAPTGMQRVAPDWAAARPSPAAPGDGSRPATSATPLVSQRSAADSTSGYTPISAPGRAEGASPEASAWGAVTASASRSSSPVPPPADLLPWSGAAAQPALRSHPALAALADGRGSDLTLVWFRARRGQRLVATLRLDGLIELPGGHLHADPDEAAAAAADVEGVVDGWRAWRLGDGGPTLLEATGI